MQLYEVPFEPRTLWHSPEGRSVRHSSWRHILVGVARWKSAGVHLSVDDWEGSRSAIKPFYRDHFLERSLLFFLVFRGCSSHTRHGLTPTLEP